MLPSTFTYGSVRNSITVSAMMFSTLITLFLVLGGNPLHPSLVRTPNTPINIIRESYDTALTKWNSLHVTEYEETVQWLTDHDYMGKWRVVVDVDPAAKNTVTCLRNFENLGYSQMQLNETASIVEYSTV